MIRLLNGLHGAWQKCRRASIRASVWRSCSDSFSKKYRVEFDRGNYKVWAGRQKTFKKEIKLIVRHLWCSILVYSRAGYSADTVAPLHRSRHIACAQEWMVVGVNLTEPQDLLPSSFQNYHEPRSNSSVQQPCTTWTTFLLSLSRNSEGENSGGRLRE